MLKYKSSLPEVFCKKGVLKHFTKFTGKRLCQGHFLNKVDNTFFYRTYPVSASGNTKVIIMPVIISRSQKAGISFRCNENMYISLSWVLVLYLCVNEVFVINELISGSNLLHKDDFRSDRIFSNAFYDLVLNLFREAIEN